MPSDFLVGPVSLDGASPDTILQNRQSSMGLPFNLLTSTSYPKSAATARRYRTVVNTGPDSAATVNHLHIHVLGGTKMGRFTFEGSLREA